MNDGRMERAGRRAKAGSLSGLSGGLPAGAGGVRRQRSLEWTGDRYSSSDDDRPAHPPLADRVFASLLAQATQQFDDEQRRIYGSEGGEDKRYVSSPQRQASPFPLENVNRRYYRRNRNSKGEEIFSADAGGGTLSRRSRRPEEFSHENNSRNARLCLNNGTASGAQSERECESPPEPAPPEVPPRGPSLHVTLRHRPAPCDPPQEPDRLYLSEELYSTFQKNLPPEAQYRSNLYGIDLYKKMFHFYYVNAIALQNKDNGNICSEILRDIKCSTLILGGEKDEFLDHSHPFYLNENIKGSELYVGPEWGHMPCIKYPVEFSRKVEDFFLQH